MLFILAQYSQEPDPTKQPNINARQWTKRQQDSYRAKIQHNQTPLSKQQFHVESELTIEKDYYPWANKLITNNKTYKEQNSLRFKNILELGYDIRLKKCIKKQDHAVLPLLTTILQDAGILDQYILLFSQQFKISGTVDLTNENIGYVSKLTCGSFSPIIEIDYINSYTQLKKEKFHKEVQNWVNERDNMFFEQPRQIFTDCVQEIIDQEFAGEQMTEEQLESIMYDPETYFSPGTMMDAQGISKTEKILNDMINNPKQIKEQLNNQSPMRIKVFAKTEPKKQRPVSNIDEASFIQQQLVKKYIEYSVTPNIINHEMGTSQQIKWQVEEARTNTDNQFNIYKVSLDEVNFDQHETRWQVSEVLRLLGNKFPLIKKYMDLVVQRFQVATVTYTDEKGKFKTVPHANGLPSGFNFTSLCGSISNSAQILAASRMVSGLYTLSGRKLNQQSLRNRMYELQPDGKVFYYPLRPDSIYQLHVNSDDTYFKANLQHVKNVMQVLQNWGHEYHHTQIISQNRYEFLRTMYVDRDVFQYPMRLIPNIVFKNPTKQGISMQEEIMKWQNQWQSLLSRLTYFESTKKMAIYDLQGISNLNFKQCLDVCSNIYSENNMLYITDSRAELLIENDKQTIDVEIMMKESSISINEVAQIDQATDSRKKLFQILGLKLANARNLAEYQRAHKQQKANISVIQVSQPPNSNRWQSQVEVRPYFDLDANTQLNLSPIEIINPQFSNQLYQYYRKKGYTPIQILNKVLGLFPSYKVSSIRQNWLVKQLYDGDSNSWTILKMALGLYKLDSTVNIGSSKIWMMYQNQILWEKIKNRNFSIKTFQDMRRSQKWINLQKIIMISPLYNLGLFISS